MTGAQELSPQHPAPGSPGDRPGPRVDVAIVLGLALAVVLTWSVAGVTRTGVIVDPAAQLLLPSIAVWVPLVAVVVWAMPRPGAGPGSVLERLGLRFRAADVVWAVGIALVARGVDALLNLGVFGTTGLGPRAVLGGTPGPLFLVLLVVGPVVVSPVVEELFFRGVLQREVVRRFRAADSGSWAAPVGVVVTALVFALMHLLVGGAAMLSAGGVFSAAGVFSTAGVFSAGGIVEFVSTFVLGLLVGGVAVTTNRLGGAVLAHVLFNGIAVVLTWSY
ncbi:lysostaphin resistance A-like protein [Curtobacterium sp. RRHDQ10]|uniref:CPBP family intramembrane glutamic endopeptidase n=1 Tax=Curtobacterium phyllosphaerae TaxID=3413379 RepID=UPI003BF36847